MLNKLTNTEILTRLYTNCRFNSVTNALFVARYLDIQVYYDFNDIEMEVNYDTDNNIYCFSMRNKQTGVQTVKARYSEKYIRDTFNKDSFYTY